MEGLKFFTLITRREFAEKYLQFFREQGIANILGELCNGTASDSVLSYLGLERTENIMFQGVVNCKIENQFKQALLQDMNLGDSGNGIAMFIPIDCIGGQFSKNYLVGECDLPTSGGKMKENLSDNVLIITIIDKGYTELVMNSARGAGAAGGTVVKANGTGAAMAKFFGVSISEEKEVVYIVSKRSTRDDIMRAIMKDAGGATEAHGVVFSLPIDSVLGIKGLE